MTFCPIKPPCRVELCDMLALAQDVLPRGDLWRIGLDNRPIFNGIFYAISEFWTVVFNDICCELGEAHPCTAGRTLKHWASLWAYPTDCVELTTAKMCEWVEIVTCLSPDDARFLPRLIGFIGLEGIDVKIEICRAITVDTPALITISGPSRWFIQAPYSCDKCTPNGENIAEFIIPECNWIIPEIECLRRRYFPASIPVKYERT